MMQTITVTEALVKVKSLKQKIEELNTKVRDTTLVWIKSDVSGGDTYHKSMASASDSLWDTITSTHTNYVKLKSAIAVSNAMSIIKINDKEWTVYQIIIEKEKIDDKIKLYEQIIDKSLSDMKSQQRRLHTTINAAIAENTSLELQDAAKIYTISPSNWLETCKKSLADAIEFRDTIDAKLNIHNATTSIKVNLT